MRRHLLLLACLFAVLVPMLSVSALAAPSVPTDEDLALTDALASRDKERIRQLGRLAEDAPVGQPFRRVDGATSFGSIMLPERADTYTIPELTIRFPESIEALGDDAYLLKDDIVVGLGATLTISSDRVSELRLLSKPGRFVTITSWRGSIDVVGSAWDRITIVSWNPTSNAPDEILTDGRAWLHTRRGSMSIAWADLHYLGFATGSMSGVAWEGRPEDLTGGDVTGSSFRYNYFGAYTFEAVDMRWRLNTFAYNIGYGFDPHDHSDHFLVEFNSAFGNGSHGIIFSRGCRFNVIRYNRSYDNGSHGIVLDDGPNTNPDGTLRERQPIASDDNEVYGNVVSGNEVGIVLDGGTRNTISANIALGNRYGIRMKDAVSGNVLRSNRLVGNTEFGIYLYNGSDDNQLTGNLVSGSESGLVMKDSKGNRIADNTISRMQRHGISLSGDVSGTTVTNNDISDIDIAISLSRVVDSGQVVRQGNSIRGEAQGDESLTFWQPLRRWGFWAVILAFPVLLGPWYTRLFTMVRRIARPSALSSST